MNSVCQPDFGGSAGIKRLRHHVLAKCIIGSRGRRSCAQSMVGWKRVCLPVDLGSER